MKYFHNFYSNNNVSSIRSINSLYIGNVLDLYKFLLENGWCKETCAPRMQEEYEKSHKTLGQCSITAFLVQDIFGGEVYGVMLKDGNLHCFNYINGVIFDLTSEQLNEEVNYSLSLLQNRNDHFVSEEKYHRYLLLKKLLLERK